MNTHPVPKLLLILTSLDVVELFPFDALEIYATLDLVMFQQANASSDSTVRPPILAFLPFVVPMDVKTQPNVNLESLVVRPKPVISQQVNVELKSPLDAFPRILASPQLVSPIQCLERILV